MSAATAEGTLAAAAEPAVVERDVAMDTLRGVAILLVIGIHSLRQPLDTAAAQAVDAALRAAVPLFLFASGYLTARSRRVPIVKRFKTVLIPYAIAFVAAYLYMALSNPAMNHRPWVALARFGLGYVFVYYYVPVYLGCMVAIWLILRSNDQVTRDGTLRLGIILSLAACFGILSGAYLDPLLARLGASADLIEEARLRDLPFWFSFMALGMLAGLAGIERAVASLAPLIAIAAIAAYAIYAAVRILALGDSAPYDSTALFVYATLLFLLFLAAPLRIGALAFIGSGSYFIYLWHIFVIMLLRDRAAFAQSGEAFASIATYAAAVTASVLALLVVRAVLPRRAAQYLGA